MKFSMHKTQWNNKISFMNIGMPRIGKLQQKRIDYISFEKKCNSKNNNLGNPNPDRFKNVGAAQGIKYTMQRKQNSLS